MSALWVSLELGALAALLVLVCVAVFVRRKEPGGAGGWGQQAALPGDGDEPEWWPEFEREFALYVAKREATRGGESATSPRLKPPPQSESA